MNFYVFITVLCFLTEATLENSFNVSGPSCENHVLASNTSVQVIKSLSMYGDQVVLLYGDENETDSVFLYRFQPANYMNHTSRPLSGLQFDKGEVLVQDLLVNVFPGLAQYIDKYEIVSLLYYSDQLVLCFFRDVLQNKTFFIIHNTESVVQFDSVNSITGEKSHAVLLFHFNDTSADVLNSGTIPAYFITLDDQSYQQGAFSISSENKFVFWPNQSRFLGIDTQLTDKLYLLSDRIQAQKFRNFKPFYVQLNLQNWRALLHKEHIYILSGHKSGTVFYFKPEPFFEYDVHTSLELRMGQMSYTRFFGCPGDQGPEPTFPRQEVFSDHLHFTQFMHSTFFYIFLLLLVFILILCAICFVSFSPALQRKFRMCNRMRNFTSATTAFCQVPCHATSTTDLSITT